MSADGEPYEINLAASGRLKLRAKVMMAEGTEESVFRACVMLHEAARIERRAVDSLGRTSPMTRLAASIEECWCLVEARDPHGASDVWSRVLHEAQEVEPATAKSMLSRLTPRFVESRRGFRALVEASPMLRELGAPRPHVFPSDKSRAGVLRELRKVLRAYPGNPTLWAMAANLEGESERWEASFDALRRAVDLSPDNQQFRALGLIAAARALSRADADLYLAEMRPSLRNASAEVCLMYAFAEVHLSTRHGGGKSERMRRALEAVNLAFPRARSEGLRKNLTALKLALDDMIAGRDPDPDILYRADLGRLAATRSDDLINVLLDDAAARVSAMEIGEAAE